MIQRGRVIFHVLVMMSAFIATTLQSTEILVICGRLTIHVLLCSFLCTCFDCLNAYVYVVPWVFDSFRLCLCLFILSLFDANSLYLLFCQHVSLSLHVFIDSVLVCLYFVHLQTFITRFLSHRQVTDMSPSDEHDS